MTKAAFDKIAEGLREAVCHAELLRTIFKRQDEVFGNVPKCPSCGNEQVQIIDWNKPAQWKCRICKFKFEFEPTK